jgi:bile acid:Na+ symporter, BASS family
MAAMDVLTNIRYWILAAVVVGLLVGPIPHASEVITIALMIMMSFSLDGIEFKKGDFKNNGKSMVLMLLCCYVVSTGVTLLLGLPFYFSNKELWIGWVLFAIIPCAVSVVTTTFLVRGNVKLSVLGLSAVYFVALALTPLLSALMLGDSMSPLEILRYTVLFIVIPLMLTLPIRKLKIGRTPKSIIINISFFLLIFTAFGSNRGYLFSDPLLVAILAVMIALRLAVIMFPMDALLKHRGVPRDDRVVYVLMSFWKNTGMGAAMALVLFDGMPEAALPCALAVVVDMIWLIFVLWFYNPSRSADGNEPGLGV